MKYIRTKDGRIIDLTNYKLNEETVDILYFFYCWDILAGGITIKKESILNQADTLEELCDRFVVVEHGLDDPFSVDFEIAKTFIGKAKVYAAIWTEWGLKYIAKMNEKGSLELL